MRKFTKMLSTSLLLLLSGGIVLAQGVERAPAKAVDVESITAKVKPVKTQAMHSKASVLLTPFEEALHANGAKSITASITTSSTYTASQSNVLNFTFTYGSPDFDWIDYIKMTFPAGMTPTAAGTIDGVSATVAGQIITWGTQVSGGSGYGPISAAVNSFSVTVTVGAITGPFYINYYVESDQYAQTTPYAVTDSVMILPFVPITDLLWDNTNIGVNGSIVSSQLNGLYPDSSTVQSGDDFTVAAGYRWYIDSLQVTGSYSAGATTPADSFTVEIWTDDMGPDSLLYTATMAPAGLATATTINLDLPDDPYFDFGHYWISVYAVYNTGSGLATTRWNWNYGTVMLGSEAHIRDETGLFGVPPFGWTPFNQLSVASPSVAFELHGWDTAIVTVADIGISSIMMPAGIGLGNVDMVLANYGTDTITSASINYGINGVAMTPYSWTGNLLPGLSTNVTVGTYTFPGGQNSIVACTSSPNAGTDVDPSNDCDSISFFLQAPIDTFPYCESFENVLGEWVQGTADDLDWTLRTGGTPSSTTGPAGAYNGLYYVYIESSVPAAVGDEAHLEALFDFTGITNPAISFYYNMYGASIGSLNIDVYNGSTWTDSVWTLSGNQGTAWGNAIVDLSAWANQNNITIRFRGVVGDDGTGIAYWSDIAIDQVCVYVPAAVDAGLTEVLLPGEFVTPGSGSPAQVVVRNFGGSDITAMNIKYSVDGGTPVSFAYTDTLAPSAIDTVSLAAFTAPAGNFHDFCAWTELTNDGDGSNDTTCSMFNEEWDLQFSWLADTSIYGQAGAESDGFYVYTTIWSGNEFVQYDLTGNYMGRFSIPGVSGVRDLAYDGKYFYGSNASPVIWKMDFNSKKLLETITVISGAAVRAIAYNSDLDAFYVNNWSTPIELVNRSGATIATVAPGASGSFYGSAYDNTGTNPVLWGFSQDGSGTEIAQIDLSTGLHTGLVYDIKRDVPVLDATAIAGGLFTQANVVTGEYTLGGLIQGESIFAYNRGPATVVNYDVGVMSVDGPVPICGLSATEDITVTLRNWGAMDATGFPVTYVLDAGTPVTETITDTLTPGEYYQFTFATQGDFSSGGMHDLMVYTGMSNDQNGLNDTLETGINNIAAVTVPYTMGFENSEDWSTWMMFDVNTDGSTWSRRTGLNGHTGGAYAQYEYNSANAANDWLISPCITLEAGFDYKLAFWYRAASASYPEKLKVYFGTDQNPAAMTNMILDLGMFSNDAYMEAHDFFQVPTDGIYYIGFNAYSDPDMWNIYVDDILVSNSTGINEPARPEVKVFPNPARDIVNIVSDNEIQMVRVLNAMGQVVLTETPNTGSMTLDISTLAYGMYVIQVDTEHGVTNHRLTIAR